MLEKDIHDELLTDTGKLNKYWKFSECPVVGALCFHCLGPRFDTWWGNRYCKPSGAARKKKKVCKIKGEIIMSFITQTLLLTFRM